MLRTFVYLVVPIVTWHSWIPACHAQLVQVAPGYVKAPFVRVYSYPDGSSYVRAPFVSVYSPGHRMGHGAHSVPTATELAEMDWRSLGQVIREASTQLEADLDHIPSDTAWRSRLKTTEIAALLPAELDRQPTDDIRQQLQEMLQIYSGLDSSRESHRIASLRSFQVLQAAVAEYVTAPEQRLRRQLFFAASQLNRTLGHFATGRGWQEYLMLSAGLTLSADNAESSEPLRHADDFAEILARFDSVNQHTDYGVIAALPEFKATRQRLADYLGQLQTSPFQRPEELPAPNPSADPQAIRP